MSGFKCGPLLVGNLRSNPDYNIATVSGYQSQFFAQWCTHKVGATRLDLAIDIFHPKPDKRHLEDWYIYYEGKKNTDEGLSKLGMVLSPYGGQTIYYGSRGDDILLRVYDKGSQMARKPNLWIRYELQFGRRYAERARVAMGESDNVTQWGKDVMHKYLADRDMPIGWIDSKDTQWIVGNLIDNGGEDLERSKVWFNSVVVPFIKRFRVKVGDEYVVDKLGLSSYIDYVSGFFEPDFKKGVKRGNVNEKNVSPNLTK